MNNLTLECWRARGDLWVLEKLGGYATADNTFEPLRTQGTQSYHVNAEGQDLELLLRCPKLFDTQLQCGEGGAVNLVMHVCHVNFKGATDLLRRLAV